jgi:cell division protein ZapA (FtsZ GTPase activity inhibitor)
MTTGPSINEFQSILTALELLEEAAEGKSITLLNLTLMLTVNVIYKVAKEGRGMGVAEEFCSRVKHSMEMVDQAVERGEVGELIVERDSDDAKH